MTCSAVQAQDLDTEEKKMGQLSERGPLTDSGRWTGRKQLQGEDELRFQLSKDEEWTEKNQDNCYQKRYRKMLPAQKKKLE